MAKIMDFVHLISLLYFESRNVCPVFILVRLFKPGSILAISWRNIIQASWAFFREEIYIILTKMTFFLSFAIFLKLTVNAQFDMHELIGNVK